ncbi:MAG: lipopolysaccharide heptosyltransferase II [Pseudomonadota bacterium]|nr:lipopolysaccharide heptosyltransferase II [Pseudomonadota bacterium]
MRAASAAGPRALVVAPQWIGDAVMCEPLLATLAARGEHLTVAALPSVAAVFAAMPQVAATVALPFAHRRLDLGARWRLARQWRGRFDVAYVLPNSLKSALVPWLAGVPRRIGYHGEGRRGLLTQRLDDPTGRPPMVEHYGALAGSEWQAGSRPRLHVDAAARDAALGAAELTSGSFWGLAPGAEYGPAKRWPAAHYVELARRLHAADGLPIALLGSPAEGTLCDEIAAAAGGDCRVLAGRFSLAQAIALLSAARGLVSNDSGLMHIGAALGLPQAAIFGSTSPEHTPPLNQRARVLWLQGELERDCIPCFARHCRYGDTRCLSELAPERAEAGLREALGIAPGATS